MEGTAWFPTVLAVKQHPGDGIQNAARSLQRQSQGLNHTTVDCLGSLRGHFIDLLSTHEACKP